MFTKSFNQSPREEAVPKKLSGQRGKNDPPVEQIIEACQQEFDTSLFSTKIGTKGKKSYFELFSCKLHNLTYSNDHVILIIGP